MTIKDTGYDNDDLRKQAEKIAKEKAAQMPENLEMSPEEARQLLHELQVHQIELEMQNDELRRAQAELEASQNRYFDLYNLAPVGYLTISEKGVILEANLTAATLLGMTRSALVRQPLSRFILPEDKDIYYLHSKQLFKTNEPQACEIRILRTDATPFWARMEAIMAQDNDGSLIYRAVMSDITERKRAEDERRLLQNQLIQTQKMESIGRLAGGVAHDFNNMLSIIMGYAEMTLDALQPSDPLQQNIREIISAGKRSTNVVRQLLTFARKQTVAPKVLDLNDTIEDILKMLRRLIGEDINLLWEPASELWLVKMDLSQIDQLLVNLVINARDAIKDVGTVTIKTSNIDLAYCEAHSGFSPGGYVLLTVSDDGCGMDKEIQANIFEPFFTTKEVGKGTGLGLATMYGIIRQNKGFINVESEPEKGCTFKIYLPRHPAEVENSNKTALLSENLTGTETVLLVEDDQVILKMGKVMLERLGYTVLTANNPDEAIHFARDYAAEIHLLITDVIMPEMNGRDLARQLTALRPKVKSLFMSGYTAGVISHHGVFAEGVNFIQKPFSRKELAVQVRKALRT